MSWWKHEWRISLLLAGYTMFQGPNLCWQGKQEAAVYLWGSGWMMCLCKQPFAQVSRGTTEREYTFIPFLTVMIQKSQLFSPRFFRHCQSGSPVLFWPTCGQARLLPSLFLLTPQVTHCLVRLQGKYQHPKLSSTECFCLLTVCILPLERKHLESWSLVLFNAFSPTSVNRCWLNGQERFTQSLV